MVGLNSGIYGLFLGEECVYIGQSKQLNSRRAQHFRGLRQGSHPNQFLQRVFNKYGTLKFRVLERCEASVLCQKERDYIRRMNPKCNLMVVRDSDGLCHTESWKKNMSLNNPSKRPEVKAQRREQLLKYNPSRDDPLVRIKISEKLKEGYASGRLTPSALGKKMSQETKEKISKASRNISSETRAKMSKSQKDRATREKREGKPRDYFIYGFLGKHHSVSSRNKMSEAVKGRKRDKSGRFVKQNNLCQNNQKEDK